jgi:O-antigen ligase
VPGFLAAAVILVLVSLPALLVARLRWPAIAAAFVVVALSGSRSAMAGLLVGGVVVVVHLVERRRWVKLVPAALAIVVLAILIVPRFRQTVVVVTRPEFVSESWQSIDAASSAEARRLSDSAVEANILVRFSFWGEAVDQFRRSPLIGIGSYRTNDEITEWSGFGGIVEVADGGANRFSNAQPHNMYLHVLAETGIVGLAALAVPYVWAALATRRRRWPNDDGEALPDWLPGTVALVRGSLAMALTIACATAGLLTTGLGIVSNLMIFGCAAVVVATSGRAIHADER